METPMVWSILEFRCALWSLAHNLSSRTRRHNRLDIRALGCRDLADLNLPPEMLNRHLAREEAQRFRRQIL